MKTRQSKYTYFFSRHSDGPRNSSLSGAVGVVGAGLVTRVLAMWVKSGCWLWSMGDLWLSLSSSNCEQYQKSSLSCHSTILRILSMYVTSGCQDCNFLYVCISPSFLCLLQLVAAARLTDVTPVLASLFVCVGPLLHIYLYLWGPLTWTKVSCSRVSIETGGGHAFAVMAHRTNQPPFNC